MTNYSRSVLKSNGLRHSKNLPVKFGFSSKTVPANIAKKLPPQRCFKPLLIPFFNFSHKWPTFALTPESGYTLAFRRKIAHNGSHAETGGVLGGGWYHYSRSVPHVSETLRGQGIERQTLPFLGLGRVCSRRTQRACGTAMRLCASLFRGAAAPLGCVALLPLFVQHDLLGWKDLTKRSGRVTITRNNRTASRLALVQRLRWAVK